MGNLSSGIVNLGGKALTVGSSSSTTYAGAINDGGLDGGSGASLIKVGTGTLTLSGISNYSGGTTISNGTLAISGGGQLNGAGSVAVNGSFDISEATGPLTIGTLSGSGNVFLGGNSLNTTNGGTTTFSGPITDGGIGGGSGGSLTKAGAGTLILTGTNLYTGGTTVSAGTLQGNMTSVQGNILNNGSVVFDQGTTGTYAGNMNGTGNLIKENTGLLILSGTNSYSGGTTINAGCIQGTTSSIQGNIANNSCLIFDQASSGTYSGILTGTGTLSINGSGSIVISGNSPLFTGPTTVNNGTLIVNGTLGGPVQVNPGATMMGIGTVGDLTSSGTVAPGQSIGTLTSTI